MKAESRCWRYSEDCPQGRIFEEGEEIPTGWVDSPADIGKKKTVKKTVKKKAKKA